MGFFVNLEDIYFYLIVDGNGFRDLSEVKLQGSLPDNTTAMIGRTALVG